MRVVVATIFLVLIGAYFWRRSEAKRGKYVFSLAQGMETAGKYEAACFHYAVSASAGYEREYCQQKVRDLWDTHGPFEFVEHLTDSKGGYCRDRTCGEGYYRIIVRDIRKIVEAR